MFILCKCYYTHANLSLPIITHCSSGVGRTGTLITIDRVLDQLQQERVVDIAGTICHLRTQRMKMVQSVVCIYVHVYIYIHTILHCRDTA